MMTLRALLTIDFKKFCLKENPSQKLLISVRLEKRESSHRFKSNQNNRIELARVKHIAIVKAKTITTEIIPTTKVMRKSMIKKKMKKSTIVKKMMN